MEGTRVWKGYGYGRDKDMERTWVWKGTMVWRGHGYGRDMIKDGTRV
mgnify:CR=1 FL=1